MPRLLLYDDVVDDEDTIGIAIGDGCIVIDAHVLHVQRQGQLADRDWRRLIECALAVSDGVTQRHEVAWLIRTDLQMLCDSQDILNPMVTRGSTIGLPSASIARAPGKDMGKPARPDLATAHWRKLRKIVLSRTDGKCARCGGGGRIHIHHLSYEHLGREDPEELVALCASCHHAAHDILRIMAEEAADEAADEANEQ